MKRPIRIFLIVVALLFVGVQFFPPDKNLTTDDPGHILKKEVVPEEIATLLKNACLDCHSNETRYLWYHHVAPVSWMIDKHVRDGKKELNLSDWAGQDAFDKVGLLDEMCEEVKNGNMPLASYTLIHKNARLSEEQKEQFFTWAEKLSESLLAGELGE